jgi:hypothetical protein
MKWQFVPEERDAKNDSGKSLTEQKLGNLGSQTNDREHSKKRWQG